LNLFRHHGPASYSAPELFFGREAELSVLLRTCLDGSRGIGAAVMLYGPPEAGKTSLLLKLGSALRDLSTAAPPRPFPLYFAFSKILTQPIALADHFLREYLGQLLAFHKAAPSDASSEENACDRLDALGFTSCRERLAAHRRYVSSGDGLSALINAFGAPFSGPVDTVYPVILFDDFQFASKIEGVPDGALLSILRPFIKSGRFPIVLSGSTPGRILAGIKREGLYGTFRIMETGPLGPEAAGRMWDSQCERRGLSVPTAVRTRIVSRLGGIPAYLRLFAEELAFDGSAVPDEIAFENVYAASVTEGGLNRYWKALFESVLPDRTRRARAVRFLKRVLCDGFPLDSVEGALTLYGGVPAEGEEALAALELKGLVRTELEHIEFRHDPVLEDFLLWGVERGVMGRSASQVASGIVQSRLSDAAMTLPGNEREAIKDTVKLLMRRWDCREVPAMLFDFESFRDRYGGKGLLEIMVGLEEASDRIRLPRISAVSRGYRTEGAGSRFDFDLVGYGFQDGEYSEEKMVAWAVDVSPGRTLTRDAVAHFENRCRLLALEKALPSDRVRKWLLFGEHVEPGAVELAAASGILLTHQSQLRLFLNLFGMDESRQPGASAPPNPPQPAATPAGPPPRQGASDDTVEFTLVLPMKADTEIVAARVVEEVAGWASLDADAIDRLKMAIIEACINAFEHSGSESGRVQLRYILSPSKIEIFVQDEGKGFRPGASRAAGNHRGWGLKLMRELVDDVEIDTGERGTVVRLVKYFDRPAPVAAESVDAG
jgi:serine/threonine-protein kinase RsbW